MKAWTLTQVKVSEDTEREFEKPRHDFTNYNFFLDIAVAELAEVSENEDYMKDKQENGKRGGKNLSHNMSPGSW
jgi:hypothetical protein